MGTLLKVILILGVLQLAMFWVMGKSAGYARKVL